MAKKPVSITADEAKEMIQLETAAATNNIAEGLFKKLFEQESARMDNKISNLIYGGIAATVLLLVGIWVSTWWFMGSYQQHYLDTQSSFNQQMNDVKKESIEPLNTAKHDMDRMKDKQDYLEKLLLEKNR